MAGTIPSDTIRQIRDRSDLVEVVRRYVQLERKGRRFVGLCPFHHEKTPSFGVSADKQLFHCFGCQVGGDVFAFLMRIEGLSFPDAARQLAAAAGVDLPDDDDPAAAQERRRRDAALATNGAAQAFFRAALARSDEARRYLHEERKLAPETVERFELGFAPLDWDALPRHLDRAQALGPAAELGLVGRRSRDGSPYAKLRGRLTFPIHRTDGRICGFGARRADWCDREGPKYLNSPESPIYDKSSVLYGLWHHQKDVRAHRRALLVEGYLDVIALHQAGVPGAVAACGTALTDRHAAVLARLADTVVTVYDGDEAGRKATASSALPLLRAGLQVHVVALPEGEDPDTFVERQGAADILDRVEAAPSIFDHILERERRSAAGAGIAGTTRALDALRPLLEAIPDGLRREVTADAVARSLRVDPATLRRHYRAKDRGQASPRPPPRRERGRLPGRPSRRPKGWVVQAAVLRCLLDRPDETIRALERRNGLDAFTSVAFQAAVEDLVASRRAGMMPTGAWVLERIEAAGVDDPTELADLRKTLIESLPEDDELDTLVERLLTQKNEHRLRQLRQQLRAAQSPEERAELEARLAAEATQLLAPRK